MACLIEVSKVSKAFGDTRALDALNLTMSPGILGLIGPNGAGKTTLLRVLLGLVRPDAGVATVLGLDATRDSLEIRSRVGVLHERPTYPRFMTCHEFLRFVAHLYRSGADPSELLALVGLDAAGNRKIGGLSAGMLQRLGIAQALSASSELIFLDEPTSNLDVTGRMDLLRMVTSIHSDKGTSFVIASHVLSELEQVCTEVAIINEGRLVAKGTPREMATDAGITGFRVRTSDSARLAALLRTDPDFVTVETLSLHDVYFESPKLGMDKSWARVLQYATSLGLEVQELRSATSLEDVFRRVVAHE